MQPQKIVSLKNPTIFAKLTGQVDRCLCRSALMTGPLLAEVQIFLIFRSLLRFHLEAELWLETHWNDWDSDALVTDLLENKHQIENNEFSRNSAMIFRARTGKGLSTIRQIST